MAMRSWSGVVFCVWACILGGGGLVGCDDENKSTLPSLRMPGVMHVVEQCFVDGNLVPGSVCEAADIKTTKTLFAANMGNGTLSYIPFNDRRKTFKVVDISLSTPGVTSISVGERPQSLAGDALGALVVLTSSIHNDVSVVSTVGRREIAYQSLDRPPRLITYYAEEDAFYVIFLDGVLRRLSLTTDCIDEIGKLPATCEITKDNLTIEWSEVTTLDGIVASFVVHPQNPSLGYVSYSNRRYVTVLGFESDQGACLDGSTGYPCEIARLGAGFGCADGIDNNGNGLIDAQDPSCLYPWNREGADGAGWLCDDDINGGVDCGDGLDWGESGMVSSGRGALGIDPKGRWLYVLDPVDSQLIVIDLATGQTIDRSSDYPRHQVVGIPVSRVALDVVGDIRTSVVYNRGGQRVEAEMAVAYVSSSSGTVLEYLIHQTLTHTDQGVFVNSVSELALRPTDTNDNASYVGSVRCVGRICGEADVPRVVLRMRPAVAYFADAKVLSDINPATGEPHMVVYDTIIASETWRVAYEGTLERTTRSDGYFSADGVFRASGDFCLIGAKPGDHLSLLSHKGLRTDLEECADLARQRLEWRIAETWQDRLVLVPTGNEGD
ncbi:MAG: hypothetical protein FWC40_09335, partial [Proteobacteria bacterium]|nr:hypothetical protein [Pseudomonadota bacterium]